MSQPTPIIKRVNNPLTGEWKWAATSPDFDWSRRWTGHRHVPIRLMFAAHRHATKLNSQEAK